MERHQLKKVLMLWAFSALSACTPFKTDDSDTAGADVQHYTETLSSELLKSGLSQEESAVLISSVESELPQESSVNQLSTATKQSGFADKMINISRGLMTGLGNEIFSDGTRRLEVIAIVSKLMFSSAKDILDKEDPLTVQSTIKAATMEAVKSCELTAIPFEDQPEALRLMGKSFIFSAAGLGTETAAKAQLIGQTMKGLLHGLAVSCLTADETTSLIPDLVQSTFDGVSLIPQTTASQQSSYLKEAISNIYSHLPAAGLTTFEINTTTTAIENKLHEVLNTTTLQLPADFTSDIQSVITDKVRCLSTPRWVYMFEYSDPRCQTMTKKSIEGPLDQSPMNRGYPNHGFCYRDSSNGKYYNWIGALDGCASEPPSEDSIPQSPSPLNLSNPLTSDNGCEVRFHSGSGILSPDTQRSQCIDLGLKNYRLNPSNYIEVTWNGVIEAVFSFAPRVLYFTPYPPQILEEETPEEVVEPTPSPTPDESEPPAPTLLLWTPPPTSFTKGECAGIGLQRTDLNNQVIPGDALAVDITFSSQFNAQGIGHALQFYSDPSCSMPVVLPHMPIGTEVLNLYFRVDENSAYIDLRAFVNAPYDTDYAEIVEIPVL